MSIRIQKSMLLLLAMILVQGAATTWAKDPVLELGQPWIEDGKVLVDVELDDFFNKDSLASLQSGMPATLVFQWAVYQQRDGWQDTKISTGEVRNRIFFDILEEQYHLFNHLGRPLGACDALSGVTSALCRRDGMVLAGAGHLDQDTRYYVKMEVSLEILSDEKVRGFESWLLGEGMAFEEDDSSLSSGLSDVFLGVVLKIVGISDETVQGQSPLFFGGT